MSLTPESLPRLNRLSFATLAYFLDVCHSQNLTNAAERLATSKSVFSEACTNLKTILDLPLLERQQSGVYPNEQALFLVKYILFIQNLEQYALRLHTLGPNTQPSYFSIKVPNRLWSVNFNRILSRTLQACAEEHPEILIWPEVLSQHSSQENHEAMNPEDSWLEQAWHPVWPEIGQARLIISEEDASLDPYELITREPWYILCSDPNCNEHELDEDLLKQERLMIPSMPWPILQAAAQFCATEHLAFEQVSQSPELLLREAPLQPSFVLVNGLVLPENYHATWSKLPLATIPAMRLSLKQQGTHPLLHLFRSELQKAWQHRAQPNLAPHWQPSSSLKQWRYLGEILAKGSVSAAAQSLFLSQPALSMQLKQFEQSLNLRLIERKTGSRQLQLTDAGQWIRQIHQGMWDVFDLIGQYCQQQRLSQTQRLLLGVLPSVDKHSRLLDLIVNQVSGWLEQFPQVRLEIVEERHQYLIHALRNQTLHLAITEVEAPWVVQWPLAAPEEMGLVIAKSLLPHPDLQTMTWAELDNVPLVLPRRGSGIRLLIDAHCLNLGLHLTPVLESDSLNINRVWIQQGRYASILPRSALASLYEGNTDLCFIRLTPRLDRVLKLTHLRNRRLSPVEEGLIAFLLKRPSALT